MRQLLHPVAFCLVALEDKIPALQGGTGVLIMVAIAAIDAACLIQITEGGKLFLWGIVGCLVSLGGIGLVSGMLTVYRQRNGPG